MWTSVSAQPAHCSRTPLTYHVSCCLQRTERGWSTMRSAFFTSQFQMTSSPGLRNAIIYIYIYIYDWLLPREYILITPASAIYALFVLNTKESRNQYRASHYGSTFEAVLHLQRNRPTSEFSQYLSCPWPRSGSLPRCYASAYSQIQSLACAWNTQEMNDPNTSEY